MMLSEITRWLNHDLFSKIIIPVFQLFRQAHIMSIQTLRTLIGLSVEPPAPSMPFTRLLRGAVGLGIAIFGFILLLVAAVPLISAGVHMIMEDPNKLMGVRNSAIAGAVTGVGALALLVMKKIDDRGLGLFIAVAAGMMAAAAVLSLFLPALLTPHAAGLALVSTALGYGVMMVLDRVLPHEHSVKGAEQAGADRLHLVSLMVVAISVHNLPEGFAVGASIGHGTNGSVGTALSIGLQNIPEGLIVATALWSIGVSKPWAAFAAFATGLVEPLGASLGVLSAHAWPQGTPASMAFAAGAMAFVVVHEMLPEGVKMIGKLKTMYVTGLSTLATSIALGWMGA
jgi:ZIP family zinc transporter